ncbi:hypothetical protein [Tychonema sp. BBK16]|uniref:hypothetical protein n=1 Tax=Tychonema sp. BBK16 TaxID=2699888 RepID=UPI001F3E275B|nr:hypothetical protein [Tychonema sp. BBK16]MCF6373632.1 hypothetical protein [Tychonema sp. BBK16]
MSVVLRSQNQGSETIRQTQENDNVCITSDRNGDSSLLIGDWLEFGKYFSQNFQNLRQ